MTRFFFVLRALLFQMCVTSVIVAPNSDGAMMVQINPYSAYTHRILVIRLYNRSPGNLHPYG